MHEASSFKTYLSLAKSTFVYLDHSSSATNLERSLSAQPHVAALYESCFQSTQWLC